MNIISKFFWWFRESNPVNLDDQSIAEILIRSIFNLKEIENLPLKIDLILWVEVAKEFDIG